MHDLRDVGGTKGGLPAFLMGLALLCVGGYLLMDRVSVHGGYWTWFGSTQSSFGVTLIPLLIGIGMLFYDAKHERAIARSLLASALASDSCPASGSRTRVPPSGVRAAAAA